MGNRLYDNGFDSKNGYPPTWYQYLFVLFDLQGLNFIFPGIKDIFIGPWFFTSIMCCYIVLWIYTSIEKKHPSCKKIFNYGGIIPLAVFVILGCMNICTKLLLIFFIGYVLAKEHILEDKDHKLLVGGMVQFVIAVAIRLITKRFMDGTRVYDNVIVALTHTGIAISALCIFKWFEYIAPKAVLSIGKNPIIRHIDKISIYVYISHDWYITGVIAALFDSSMNPILLYPLFACLVFLTATILYFVFEKLGTVLTNQISRKEM